MIYILAEDHRTIGTISVVGSSYAGADIAGTDQDPAGKADAVKEEEVEILDPTDPEANKMQKKALDPHALINAPNPAFTVARPNAAEDHADQDERIALNTKIEQNQVENI